MDDLGVLFCQLEVCTRVWPGHLNLISSSLQDHKFTAVEEMDRWLGKPSLPKLTQEETEYLTSPLSLKDTKFVT